MDKAPMTYVFDPFPQRPLDKAPDWDWVIYPDDFLNESSISQSPKGRVKFLDVVV